jgi:hypothetical protein
VRGLNFEFRWMETNNIILSTDSNPSESHHRQRKQKW